MCYFLEHSVDIYVKDKMRIATNSNSKFRKVVWKHTEGRPMVGSIRPIRIVLDKCALAEHN